MRFLNRPLGDMYALAFPKEPCSGATQSKSADPALMRWSRASSNERSSFRSAGSGHSSLSKASSTPIASAMPENVYATDQPKLCGSKDAEIKRVKKSDYDIKPCANELSFVQSVRQQRSRQPKEWQQHPRYIDHNARKENRSA